jgi:tetratricopeptide (TPR) repeat protein
LNVYKSTLNNLSTSVTVTALRGCRYQAAAMYYSGALDLVDDVAAYATNLAAAHVMLKDWPAALAAADRSLRVEAGNPKAHYRRAQALEGLGRLEEAVAAYEAGLAALPGSEALAKGLRAATERLEARQSATSDALEQIRRNEAERRRRAEEEAVAAAAAVAAAVAANQKSAGAVPAEGNASKGANAAGNGAAAAAAAAAGGAAGVPPVPKTGAEFRKGLRGVRRSPVAAMAYLRVVGADRLAGLLSGGVEEEELVAMLQALDGHAQGGAAAAAAEAFGVLEGVSRAGRVRIACAMLDRREAARLQALLLRLHPTQAGGGVPYSVEDWARVRVALGV